MEQCPKCGRYLRFKMVYRCGSVCIGYDCTCGYDSFKDIHNQVTASTSTNFGGTENEKYSTKVI